MSKAPTEPGGNKKKASNNQEFVDLEPMNYATIIRDGRRTANFVDLPKTSELERLLHQLRKDFSRLLEISSLGPIKKLRDKIRQKLGIQGTTIDSDHLLIEIFSELDRIVKNET